MDQIALDPAMRLLPHFTLHDNTVHVLAVGRVIGVQILFHRDERRHIHSHSLALAPRRAGVHPKAYARDSWVSLARRLHGLWGGPGLQRPVGHHPGDAAAAGMVAGA